MGFLQDAESEQTHTCCEKRWFVVRKPSTGGEYKHGTRPRSGNGTTGDPRTQRLEGCYTQAVSYCKYTTILGVRIQSVCLACTSQRPLNQHVWITGS